MKLAFSRATLGLIRRLGSLFRGSVSRNRICRATLRAGREGQARAREKKRKEENAQRLDIFETPVTMTPQQKISKSFNSCKNYLKILNVYFWGTNVYFWGTNVYFWG